MTHLTAQLTWTAEALGRRFLSLLRYAGALTLLGGATAAWMRRMLLPPRSSTNRAALAGQLVRIGVRSVGVVILVHLFIGVILALQMAPPLRPWGQEDKIANMISVASFRILAPIITAVVLSGFAGASIAAELGTMVVAEEIEALRAIALNPVRFLVVPRVLATIIMAVLLSVIADLMVVLGGYLTAEAVLSPAVASGFFRRAQMQLQMRDFVTGLVQAGVFGLLISLIACHEGLSVTGGAEGVGKATTMTVVYSIVTIIVSACVFTVIFYTFGL